MKKNKIKVSIIIPVYNVEEYIEQCLESVVNQTLKEIEIIIVNDGTKDNSMKKIEKFLSDERITVINKENGGVSSARNAGIKIAKGEYISFVDPDDFIDEMMLEKLYKDTEDKDIIISNIIECNNGMQEKKQVEMKKEIREYNKGSYFWRCYGFSVCNKIHKRKYLENNNIKFIEGIILEDVPFNFYSLFLSNKVKYVESAYYYYRFRRENSTMNTLDHKKLLNAFNKINMALENFAEEGVDNIFSKLRIYIWKIYYISEEKRYGNTMLSKNIIREFEKRIKKDYKELTEIEKEIIKEDLEIFFKNKMFWRINIFDSFYWKNNIFTKKTLRRIVEGKIINIFKDKK
ncbi:glycosyltransferase involved in cell wall biosynthesis [Fusobacterium sp. PH5-7]|uniref:glycosyltransferase n=1 Tax=Fusobacterium sp. PH5-7 TaxID=2940528 RepID=UPI00247485BB|nr:glycosyltransferase [Fusobacterium sp. PH5-7]MDH6456546.1 glycosyltransferase involved in cell wall biosynthesis [Fusobacterium sp. PH5-7]